MNVHNKIKLMYFLLQATKEHGVEGIASGKFVTLAKSELPHRMSIHQGLHGFDKYRGAHELLRSLVGPDKVDVFKDDAVSNGDAAVSNDNTAVSNVNTAVSYDNTAVSNDVEDFSQKSESTFDNSMDVGEQSKDINIGD
jgi:hypothetical protein